MLIFILSETAWPGTPLKLLERCSAATASVDHNNSAILSITAALRGGRKGLSASWEVPCGVKHSNSGLPAQSLVLKALSGSEFIGRGAWISRRKPQVGHS